MGQHRQGPQKKPGSKEPTDVCTYGKCTEVTEWDTYNNCPYIYCRFHREMMRWVWRQQKRKEAKAKKGT